MKKFLAALFALTLVFAFAACGASEDTAEPEEETAAEETTDNTEYYDFLAGDYQDTISEKATAVVVSNGDSVSIEIDWANSADELTVWTMTAAENEDGQLAYSDCTKAVYTFTEDGVDTIEDIIYTDGEGYFFEVNGVLNWVGAADEECKDCSFAKPGAELE